MVCRRLLLPVLLAAAGGCGGVDDDGSDQNPQTTKPICAEIASACHRSADATGEACHVMGHAVESTEAECHARREECLGICGEGGGHGH